jgi:hypothetical protein
MGKIHFHFLRKRFFKFSIFRMEFLFIFQLLTSSYVLPYLCICLMLEPHISFHFKHRIEISTEMRNELRRREERLDWEWRKKMNHNEFPPTQCRKLCKKLDFHFQFSLPQLEHWKKLFFIKIKKRNFHRKRHFRLCHFVNFTYIPLHFIQGLDIYKNWKQIPFQTETTSEREPNSCTPKKNSLFFAIAIEIHHAEHAFVGNERENIISKRYCAMLNRIYTRIDYSEFHIENWFCIFLCVLFSSSFAAAYLPSSKRETTQICAMLREYFTKKSLFFLFYHPWKIKLVYPANCIL